MTGEALDLELLLPTANKSLLGRGDALTNWISCIYYKHQLS
ncbi:hypothetical protein BTN50_0258 [Candidatus Enterovibrio altilux]|uniref:Uncharacterized protein n=1 Tax=Candidatus Enterovibrio altilux TaxID=1927128 RepID=A0A291B739_9GAMM|nr:hypothetical protein BTN50_0258 [Candidatus Enterovibrio luxaltus]